MKPSSTRLNRIKKNLAKEYGWEDEASTKIVLPSQPCPQKIAQFSKYIDESSEPTISWISTSQKKIELEVDQESLNRFLHLMEKQGHACN